MAGGIDTVVEDEVSTGIVDDRFEALVAVGAGPVLWLFPRGQP